MPLVNAAHVGKAAGLYMVFATVADLVAAVAAEGASWPDGQRASVSEEADSGAERIYRTGLGHARTVQVGLKRLVLPGNTNVVRATTGMPASGVGATGDAAVDTASGSVFSKASGSWAAV